MSEQYSFSRRAQRTTEPPISWLLQQGVSNPDVISLAAGLVDPPTLPVREVETIVADLMADPEAAREALQYGTGDGYTALRRTMLERFCAAEGVKPDDLALSVDDILITTGSQQLLLLVADVLFDPGDILFLSDPSYFVFMSILTAMGVHSRGVTLDEEGMVVDELAAKLEAISKAGELDRVKAIYVTSYYQNPTGVSLSADRRRQLFDVVRHYSSEHRIIVIEDAAYRELRYDGDDVPSIKSMDIDNTSVVYCGTFSKAFAPGLRTGWSILPKEPHVAIARQKANHDFGSCNFTQHILASAMSGGQFDKHVEEVRSGYRRKRDAMLDALERNLPEGVSFIAPEGGLYVWVILPEGVGTGPGSHLFDKAFERGMIYVPGEFCYCAEDKRSKPTNHLRLCFGPETEDNIREGVRRLCAAMADVVPR